MKWKQVNHAVYTATSSIVRINADDISMLKNKVVNSTNKRTRICAHQSPDASLHEMLISIMKPSYVRPHKHINKSESFLLLEGEMDVIIFEDAGEIKDIIPMGPVSSGKNFYYRLSAPYFHTLILQSDLVVFHEITNGPFLKEETVYPNWSPLEDQEEDVKQFQHTLTKKNCSL